MVLKPNQEFFVVPITNDGRESCAIYYIYNVVLERLVQEAISDLADFVHCYEPVVLYMMAKKNNVLKKTELQRLKHTVRRANSVLVRLTA